MAVKSSFKNMTLCLLAICLVCSSLLAGVYWLTAEPIAKAAAAKNEAAIKEVLPETAVTIEEERTVEMEGENYTYNLAYDQLGNTVGCAINVSALGFGGPINVKVGFDINGVICNTKVLAQADFLFQDSTGRMLSLRSKERERNLPRQKVKPALL